MGAPTDPSGSDDRDPFLAALARLGGPLLAGLDTLEEARRRLHPPDLASLRKGLAAALERLEPALEGFRAEAPPEGLAELAADLTAAAELARDALRLFTATEPAAAAVPHLLRAMHLHCRAQQTLFPLRKALPPVNRFFLEPACRDRVAELDPEPAAGVQVGLFAARNAPDERGGFSLYVPESYDGLRPWPLVVALHGGGGHGADFVWTWLREARSYGFLLLAPTSQGSTWSLLGPDAGPDADDAALRSMLAFVSERWRVDPARVLLTGLSDGATYTMICGLRSGAPYTALAPVSGVLHPGSFAAGGRERVAGRRVYLVHGARDWMFPVALARLARDELTAAGADLVYRELDDLSHTYPREENARILAWLDPGLVPAGA